MQEDKPISRKRLHKLVWSQPATSLAKELGLSDVALGKLCRKLQVPKPPPGYWARIQAGQKPPKPALPPYDPEKKKPRRLRQRGIHLSPRKLEVFEELVGKIQQAFPDVSWNVHGNRLIDIDSHLAAQLVVRLEQLIRAETPSPVDEPYQQAIANRRTYAELANLILLETRGTIAIFEIERYPRYLRHDEKPDAALLHLTPNLQQEIAAVHQLVVSNRLGLATIPAGRDSVAWRVTYLRDPSVSARANSEVCVSADSVWVRITYDAELFLDNPRPSLLETERQGIYNLIPLEALSVDPVALTATLPERFVQPFQDQLAALLSAQQQIDEAYEAWSRTERDLGGSALLDAIRLPVPQVDVDVLEKAKEVVERAHDQLAAWQDWVDREEALLAERIFGVAPDDIVQFTRQDRIVTIRVSHIHCWVTNGKLIFNFHGRRFRKDGMLGKINDQFFSTIRLSNSTKSSGRS